MDFWKKNIRKHTEDIHALNNQIFAQAKIVLTPEPYQAFEVSLQATTDMQLAQFEMVGQLVGRQKN